MISDAVVTSAITAIATITVAGFTYLGLKLNTLHTQVNSRMTELLELTKRSSKAEGIKEQKENPQ